jgi:hypothetical protein
MNKYATVYYAMLNKIAAGEAAIGGLYRGVTAPPARIGSGIPKWNTPAKTQLPSFPNTRMPQQPRVGGTLGSIASSIAQGPSTPTAAPAPSTIPAGSGSLSGQTDWGRYSPLLRRNGLLEKIKQEEEERRMLEEERLRDHTPRWYPGKKYKPFKDMTSDDIQKEYEERMKAPLYIKGPIPLPKPNIDESMRIFGLGKYRQPQSK